MPYLIIQQSILFKVITNLQGYASFCEMEENRILENKSRFSIAYIIISGLPFLLLIFNWQCLLIIKKILIHQFIKVNDLQAYISASVEHHF